MGMGDLQDPIYGATLVPYKAMFCWDIPWNLGLKNRPFFYGRYLQSIGSWNSHWMDDHTTKATLKLTTMNWSIRVYKVGPPSYKMVYKPHEYYSYRYHKPVRDIGVMFTNLAIVWGPHIVSSSNHQKRGSDLTYTPRILGKFHHDRTLFSRSLEIMVNV